MGFWSALFGRPQPQVKESATGSVVAMYNVGRAQSPPRDYEHLAKEVYKKNIIAYKCIAIVSKAAAGIPWVLYRGDTEVDAHPLLDLLAKPNPMQDGCSFFESVYGYDLLTGNSYVERARAGATMEMYALRPDRMRVVPGARGWPMAYEYKVNGRTVRWGVDPLSGASDVLHMKHFSPLDDWYGQSPLEAAGYAVDQHNEASKWNRDLLMNGAKPSGALRYSGDGELSDDQFNRMRAELDNMGSGSGKTGRPMLLEGGLEWVQMMLTQTDMDWLPGMDKAASYIAQAFDVPEQIVGVPGQQTYSNNREARLALYEDAVIPLVYRYANALTKWLVQPELGDQWRLSINEDDIPALAPRKEMQFDRLNTAGFLTINEKREALGYEPVEGGDTIMVSAGNLPLSFAAEPPEINTMPEERAAEAAYGTKWRDT